MQTPTPTAAAGQPAQAQAPEHHPTGYTHARWRYTLPPEADGSVGVAFDLADGSRVRLHLSAVARCALIQTLSSSYWREARKGAAALTTASMV